MKYVTVNVISLININIKIKILVLIFSATIQYFIHNLEHINGFNNKTL